MHEFIYRRRSIRKFLPDPVPREDLEACLRAAQWAPSGRNAQNWHFVVLQNPERIRALADAVEAENLKFQTYTQDPEKRRRFQGSLHYQTLFRNAPAVILIYASAYSVSAMELLRDKPPTSEEVHRLLRHNPGIQNIGAAMENLLLAAAELGYGTCWMTGPVYAEEAVNRTLGFEKEGYYLACMTPFGKPDGSPQPQPDRKPLPECVTWID